MADASINVDMIVQSYSADGNSTDMTFTVTKGDMERAVAVLDELRDELKYDALTSDPNA